MDKYYASASLRRDGSSVFHPDHRWGTFWSVGASWRINQEDFLKDVKAIQNLKLRVSYGVQGNDYLYLPGSSVRAYTPYTNLYQFLLQVQKVFMDLSIKVTRKSLGKRTTTWT